MRVFSLIIGLLGFVAPIPHVTAQEDVNEEIFELFEKAEKSSPTEKSRLLRRIVKLLPERNRLEDKELTRRFAKLLRSASPEEARKLLGIPTLIVRQIIYRRFREQWHYETPLRLLIVVDTKQGQPPTIQTVQPRSRVKP